MLWLRRIIAIPLALTFIILFIFLLVVFRVNATAGNPDFYIDQLHQADIYNFIYDETLPAALEEAEIDGDNSEAGINISEIKPHIIDVIRQTLPPEWLQTQVERVIDEVLPYALGDTEDFIINIPLKDRVEVTAQAAKDTLHREEVFPNLYDQAIGLILNETVPKAEELPPPFALSRDELESILRMVLPMEWALTQIDSAIDELVPYCTKDKEQFTVQVDILERLDALEVVIADMLKRPETYDYLFEDVVAPAIKQNTQEITQLPIGVALTDDEVLLAIKEVLPLEWYQERVTDIVAQIFLYFRGTRETVEVVIPLADRKPVVTSVLSELVDQKLENLIDSVPPCTAAQLADLLSNPPLNSLPECRPLDMSYSEFKDLLGIDISILLAPFVDMWIPDQFVFSDAELRQLLAGEGDEDMLTQARELVQNGLTYTDEDLRADLEDDYETIEDIRQRIAVGFIFTDEELREWAVSVGNENAEQQWQNVDEIRSWIGTGRRWIMVAWLIPLLLLVSIGALCGRNWRRRLIWAASVLALASAMVYIAFGPLFSALARPKINEALMLGIDQADGVQALIANKGIEIAQNVIDGFIGGINTQALILLLVSLVAIVVASLWYTLVRKRES